MRALSLMMFLSLACTNSTPPAGGDAELAAPTDDGAIETIVVNLNDRCEYTVAPQASFPDASARSSALPRGETRLQIAASDALYLRGASGSFTTSASVDLDGGGIIVQPGCNGVAVSDHGFSPLAIASAAAHDTKMCCSSCDQQDCEGCEARPASGCSASASVQALCAVVDEVAHCASPDAVKPDGQLTGWPAALRLAGR